MMGPQNSTHGNDVQALSIAQAARALNVGRSTLYKLLANGTLRSVRVGRRRLIPLSEIARLLSEAA